MNGFLIDDRSWAISELVVDAGSWISCKEVRIPPERVDRISYEDSTVFVNLTKADIEPVSYTHLCCEPRPGGSRASGSHWRRC